MLSPQQAISLALQELSRHGLDEWSFRLDHARQRCGSCHFTRREITISKHLLVRNDPAEFLNTLRHEIAHALVGPGHAHDAVWRAAARRVGARPEATNPTADMPPPRWALTCDHCRQVIARRHRRSLDLRTVRCAACGVYRGTVQWSEEH